MGKVRSLLSVLLVCCLLVNVVPVNSKAVGVEAVVVPVAAASVVGSVLIGLGVLPSETADGFTAVVNDAILSLTESGWIQNGTATVFHVANGNFKYAVKTGFMEALRSFLFQSGILTDYKVDVPDVSVDSFTDAYEIAEAAPYAIFVRSDSTGNWAMAYSDQPLSHDIASGYSTGYIHYSSSASYVYVMLSAGSGFTSVNIGSPYRYSAQCKKPCSTFNFGVNDNAESKINTSVDVSLGQITSNDIDFSDAYSTWNSAAVTLPNGSGEEDDEIIIPIGIAPTYEETIGKTQEDIWAGASEYEVEAEGDSETGTGTETGLLSSILSAVKSIPSAFEGWFKDLIDLAGEIGEAIIGLPARIKDALTPLFQDVVNVGQAVVDAVLGIPQAIADVLTAIFVPAQAYVEAKVDALYAQFPFVQSIIATGEELKGAVIGSSGPPVIYVDLGLAPSGDFGSQKVLLTDFSWYEPYKQRVDTLLSAALWALFGWRMYLRLPSIISGEGGIMIASERAYRKLGDD